MVAPNQSTRSSGGQAALDVALVFGASTVTSAFATSPMKLLTPVSRGRSVWVYTSSFGGGLVAGDKTRLDVRLADGTRCFIGTQASTKVYRNPNDLPCSHTTWATVGASSLLVFAPDPVQAFAASAYTQRQEFLLATDASLVLVDWFTSGRAARGERWEFRRFQTRNAVFRCGDATLPNNTHGSPSREVSRVGEIAEAKGELAFLDSLRFDPEDGALHSKHRTGRFNCFATLLLLGPAVQPIAKALLAEIAQESVAQRSSLLVSASSVRDGAVLRLAGEDVESVGRELRRHLMSLRDQLGDDPWSRKW